MSRIEYRPAGVSSVVNSDGTLTVSPTTGAVVASLALGHPNVWTALQTFGNNISLGGAQLKVSGLAVNNLLQYDGLNWVNVTPASIAPVSSVFGRIGAVVAAVGDYAAIAETYTVTEKFQVVNTQNMFTVGDGSRNVIAVDTRNTVSGVATLFIDAPSMTIASAAGVTYSQVLVNTRSITLTGTTTVTAMNGVVLNLQNTVITDASVVTVTTASTLYIGGAPIASVGVTITNAYALHVAAGTSFFGGGITGTGNTGALTLGTGALNTANTWGANQSYGGNRLIFSLGQIGWTGNNNNALPAGTLMAVGMASEVANAMSLVTSNAAGNGYVERLRIYGGSAAGSGQNISGEPFQIGGVLTGAQANQIWTAALGGSTTTLYIGNASINVTVSSKRWKENIAPASLNALSTVDKMHVREFDYKQGEWKKRGKWVGLIAEEVMEIPELRYAVTPDAVEYHHLVGLLIKAVQELSAKVAAVSG